MPIRFETYILLKKNWKPDFTALGEEIEWRYPDLGKARSKRSAGAGEGQGSIVLDGAEVKLWLVTDQFPKEQLISPARIIGQQDPEPLTAGHSCYMLASVEAQAEGLDWARAYAAVLTLVASVVADKASALSIFWKDSWRTLTVAEFKEAAGAVACGRSPIDTWVSYAAMNPSKIGGPDMVGFETFGLRPFIGREIELAPCAVEVPEANAAVHAAVEAVLGRAHVFEDGDRFDFPSGRRSTVRLSDGFARMGIPAIVLVPDNAAVSADTLMHKPMARGAVGGNGFVSRLLRRKGG